MALITKQSEKFANVLEQLGSSFTHDEFVEKFKELYPKDWVKVSNRYTEHEQRDKKGHPMPNPRQYILNVSHKLRKEP
ncbi:hypothetical protein [Paenibacillus sp. FSL R5-0473]|uniref:hypothetical protein n=1 Tax=Paenibacillus sp. FSL R5-0473 TaxID=2921642 RepID=UPI0030F783E4